MKIYIFLPLLTFLFSSCSSDNSDNIEDSANPSASIDFPISEYDEVDVRGKITYWYFDGNGGCHGFIELGGKEYALWDEDDLCNGKYSEGQVTNIKITYKSDHQYGQDTTYTVVN